MSKRNRQEEETRRQDQAYEEMRLLLDDAKGDVSSNRMNVYGSPQQNYERIATLWNAYFIGLGEDAALVSEKDVAVCMILVKIARIMQTPSHYDTWKDIAGYGAVGWVTAITEELDNREDQ
jgi:hypothetical protein